VLTVSTKYSSRIECIKHTEGIDLSHAVEGDWWSQTTHVHGSDAVLHNNDAMSQLHSAQNADYRRIRNIRIGYGSFPSRWQM
jgi:hypothetical protein